MSPTVYTPLQLRELFHIEFLRWLARKLKADHYALKGGVNLRLFFKSIRYSEDMDIDVKGVAVHELKDLVMTILRAPSFREGFFDFGIRDIILPDMRAAKQTQTTQRFKVHLITAAGLDLFTKIEFSRRGFGGKVVVESVPAAVLRGYMLMPLVVAHYDEMSAVGQKINALASRSVIQARDIFDLYALSNQTALPLSRGGPAFRASVLGRAYDRVFEVDFDMFRDTVVFYLSEEDRHVYERASSWEEIKLKVAHFIEELKKAA